MAKQTAVTVVGLDEVMAGIGKFDADARKAIAAGITKVPKEVADKTRRKTPGRALSGWGQWSRRGAKNEDGSTNFSDVGALTFDQAAIAKGIKVLPGGKRMNVRLVNRAASGAAFEMVGSKNPTSQFAKAVAGRWGPAPRLLVRTWREEKGITKTASAIGREMRKAEDILRRAGGS
jgi:hypothetical protein